MDVKFIYFEYQLTLGELNLDRGVLKKLKYSCITNNTSERYIISEIVSAQTRIQEAVICTLAIDGNCMKKINI